MAQAKTSNRYAGKLMIHDVKVLDIQQAMNAADKSPEHYVTFKVADLIHSALEYQLLERICNIIGERRCYEDNSYYEGVIDALQAAGIITKEQKQEITNIKRAWWERISANIEKGGEN